MNNKQVVTIITQGRAYRSSSFLLKMAENKDKIKRNTSFITPKKQFKTAVQRNKARRVLKAAILKCFEGKKALNKDFLYVFTLNTHILSLPFTQLVEEFKIFSAKNDIL